MSLSLEVVSANFSLYKLASSIQDVPKKRGQNDMADQSYNKDQKSHRNMGSQTPVEDTRSMRGRCGADTSRAKGD
ncbi:hypothetical protein HNY73_007425 [Argiope bruennichi]|uniref:Uncharacterized protein n=1 Tax=Argiope bruennichi TaxID=94029 RepID=A0A8T0FGH3_ARGBR|nr:hypothetical protein HNY73_007425 [Argiope bruennichi]